jgi:hypothetical protein
MLVALKEQMIDAVVDASVFLILVDLMLIMFTLTV